MSHDKRRSAATPWLVLAALSCAVSCKDGTVQGIPNRALDRPMDVATTCAQVVCPIGDDCHVEMLPLRECGSQGSNCLDYKTAKANAEKTDTNGSSVVPQDDPAGSPQIIGFVANSERNELAVFRQCDGNLVDLDIDTPGFNFVPVGELPSALAVSNDGCRVVSANRGVHSCDLSVVDARGIAALALRVDEADPAAPPSLVSRLEPLRYDADPLEAGWKVLGTRPSEVVAVPRRLTTSTTPNGGSGLDTCGPDSPGSVYVSFPSCDLVAEIDLVSHQILQSVQLRRTADGKVEAIDTGVNPLCPVDCPGVFDGVLPPDLPLPNPDGLSIDAIALVTVAEESEVIDDADLAVADDTLFIAGIGMDELIEIPVGDDGRWQVAGMHTLDVVGAGGIERIRATPAMRLYNDGFGDDYQFLYLIAGDGSTRVVKRHLDPGRDELGRECDTQIDPAALDFDPESYVCAPVAESVGQLPIDRRPYARGPGIRPSSGARITDWTFKKQADASADESEEGDGSFGGAGQVIGLAVTNGGAVHNSVFGQFQAATLRADDNPDPLGFFDIGYRAHMLMPAVRPDPSSLTLATVPSVEDIRSVRRIGPDFTSPTRRLSPTLRRVDHAYVGGECPQDPTDPTAPSKPCLPGFRVADNMGGEDSDGSAENGFFREPVVRAVAPDHRSWIGGEWKLEWEALVPGTLSTTGRIECDSPGWEGGTCAPGEAGESRLHDESATFCSQGVIAGDKLVIAGCTKESGCGVGQRCLTKPSSRSDTGICVSEQDFDARAAELREICSDFIDDPCGPVSREYLITRAFQDELWLQSLDIPPTSVLVDDPSVIDPLVLPSSEEEFSFVCTEEQPDGGCDTTAECQVIDAESMCVEGLCRRPCREDDPDGKGCMLRRLPGPACFAEFVTYGIHARNSYLVRGPGSASFLHDRVRANEDGECVQLDADDDSVSALLTSRIPLGPSDDNLGLPYCDDDVEPQFAANPCIITTPRPANGLSLFHYLSVAGGGAGTDAQEPVTAVRYSNPSIQLVLDLTSIDRLMEEVPNADRYWPSSFRAFRRSRIPPGFSEAFRAAGAPPESRSMFLNYSQGITPLTLPVRIMQGARGLTSRDVYVVDSSGPGGGDDFRGQVVLLKVSIASASLDTDFNGVH